MVRFSRRLAVGAAMGLCLSCSPSDETPNGSAAVGHAGSSGRGGSGSSGSAGSPGSSGSGTLGSAGSLGSSGSGSLGSAGSGSLGSAGSLGSSGSGSLGSAGSLGSSGSGSGVGAAGSPPVLTSGAAEIAAKLGRKANFLIGMGNDLDNDHDKDGAFTLGTTLDLHYAYLAAYQNNGTWGSWRDWNPNGGFIDIITSYADKHGVVPMISLYSMAAAGDGVLSGLASDSFEKNYWSDVKLLFQRLGAFGKPSVVHFEPDFWAYAQQQSNGDPTKIKVALKANAPDCADLSEDVVGMGHCIIKLARLYAPKAVIGFHASQWAGDAAATAAFLKKVGADKTDVMFADMLDRDAGCFEAKVDPNCQRGGSFYWDETNKTSPNFHEYLAWSKTIGTGVGRPMIWWQIPFGVPSDTPGGTKDHYRDNRVRYIFSHIQEFVDAGGLGAAFGVGAGNQTYITTDGGQFKNAVKKYYEAPVPLR